MDGCYVRMMDCMPYNERDADSNLFDARYTLKSVTDTVFVQCTGYLHKCEDPRESCST